MFDMWVPKSSTLYGVSFVSFVSCCSRYTCKRAMKGCEKMENISLEDTESRSSTRRRIRGGASTVLTIATSNYNSCVKGDAANCKELVHDVLMVVEPALVLLGSGLDQRSGEVARLAASWAGGGATGLEKYVKKYFRRDLRFTTDSDQEALLASKSAAKKELLGGKDGKGAGQTNPKQLAQLENVWATMATLGKNMATQTAAAVASHNAQGKEEGETGEGSTAGEIGRRRRRSKGAVGAGDPTFAAVAAQYSVKSRRARPKHSSTEDGSSGGSSETSAVAQEVKKQVDDYLKKEGEAKEAAVAKFRFEERRSGPLGGQGGQSKDEGGTAASPLQGAPQDFVNRAEMTAYVAALRIELKADMRNELKAEMRNELKAEVLAEVRALYGAGNTNPQPQQSPPTTATTKENQYAPSLLQVDASHHSSTLSKMSMGTAAAAAAAAGMTAKLAAENQRRLNVLEHQMSTSGARTSVMIFGVVDEVYNWVMSLIDGIWEFFDEEFEWLTQVLGEMVSRGAFVLAEMMYLEASEEFESADAWATVLCPLTMEQTHGLLISEVCYGSMHLLDLIGYKLQDMILAAVTFVFDAIASLVDTLLETTGAVQFDTDELVRSSCAWVVTAFRAFLIGRVGMWLACVVFMKITSALVDIFNLVFTGLTTLSKMVFTDASIDFGDHEVGLETCEWCTTALELTPIGPVVLSACYGTARLALGIGELFDVLFAWLNDLLKDYELTPGEPIFATPEKSKTQCRWFQSFPFKRVGAQLTLAAFVACTISYRFVNIVEYVRHTCGWRRGRAMHSL